MHFVSKLEEKSAPTPERYDGHSRGFRRSDYVDHSMGSVHMGVGICYLDSDGEIQSHLHSFEESFYILDGEVALQTDGQSVSLRPGDFGLIRTGVPHAWHSTGGERARWLEMQAPQPRPVSYGEDTFFVSQGLSARNGDGTGDEQEGLLIGHFDESQLPTPGGQSQMEGFNPLSGVAIKMFVDRSFGAIHQSLFLIQYMPGAKIDPHDHTFEESYLIVSGRVRATADGETHNLGPGDVIWTGVGCIHSFENVFEEPVRWIETQAPLPPSQEVFRFERDWVQFAGVQ